jgi:hypothetical protein
MHLISIDSEGNVFDILSLEGIQKSISLKINTYGPVIRIWTYHPNEAESPILVILSSNGVISVWRLKDEKELLKHELKVNVYGGDKILTKEGMTLALINKKE